jgi:two-component system cell cycle sensor histidine kinase/response regulator CckA
MLRLRGKIVLVTVAIVAFAVGANTLISSLIFTRDYSEALRSKVLVIAQNLRGELERLLAFEIPLHELVGFEEQCRDIVQRYKDISYAMVVDRGGRILFHNDPSQHGIRLGYAVKAESGLRMEEPVQAFLEHKGEYYDIVLPIYNRDREIIASIRLGFQAATITHRTKNLIASSVAVAAVLFSVAILPLILTLSAWVTNPLRKLSTAVQQLGKRGTGGVEQIEIDSKDELGELAAAFNQMTLDLQHSTVSVDFLNNILASMIDAIIVSDPNLTIRTVNQAACEILSFREQELVGKPVEVIFPASEAAYFRDKVSDLTSGSGFMSYESRFQTKERQLVPVLIGGSVINDRDGTNINLVFTGKDITEIKKAEKAAAALQDQLRRSQRLEAIGTLAGGIAHDFNNILMAVSGYTELTLSKVPDDRRLRSYLQNVLQAGRRASALIDQILTFSRQREEEKKPVQVSSVVKEVLQLLRASLPVTIEIRQRIDPDLGDVLADPIQIHQVLMNLCTNSAHAMQEKGGILEVSLEGLKLDSSHTGQHPQLNPGPYLKMTVNDTGHGMEPHILERVFEPYFTTKEMGRGTGLGLAVVHGIVTSHGGAITASSEAGKGSTFTVYLPVIESKAAGVADMNEAVPKGHERILFVDDEQALVDLQKLTLEDLGYQVTTRTSSVEALELFREKPERFDLVITDMTMPNMTGDVLASELMRIRPDIPVIICTGFSESLNEKTALARGIRAFVMKPVLKSQIARAIRKVLDGKGE